MLNSGHLIVWDDGSIGGLQALSALQSVSGQLVIISARNGLNLLQLPKLKDTSALVSLSVIDKSLVVAFCPLLTNINGFSPLMNEIGTDLWLQSCPKLIRMPGLRSNAILTRMPGLRNIEKIGWRLTISNCHALQKNYDNLLDPNQSIENNVEKIGWRLTISNCHALQTLDDLPALRSVGGEILLKPWALWGLKFCPRSVYAYTQGFELGISLALLFNPQLRDVGLAKSLTRINGDLQISGNTNLQSLDGLSKIQSVKLNLVISKNSALTSLQGMGSIQTVGYLVAINNNDNLASLAGLPSLTSIGQDLFVRGNLNLKTMEGFAPALKSIGGSIYIQDNGQLGSAGSLPNSLVYVGEHVKGLRGLNYSAP
eukprot:gene26863-4469_t